jgi:membrane-bound metal-dependent hydrolase YbcI (DUF457 family)
MNAREHVIISVATTTAAVVTLKTAGLMQISDEAFITGLAITSIASLIPDVDHPESTITRSSFGLLIFGLVLFFLPAGMLTIPFHLTILEWIQSQYPNFSSLGYQQILGASLVLISLIMGIDSRLLPHRGPSHSLVCWLVETGSVYATFKFSGYPLPGLFSVFFAWGILSHLLADCFTSGDAPDLFWPFSIDTGEATGMFFEEFTSSFESFWETLNDLWFQIRLRWF